MRTLMLTALFFSAQAFGAEPTGVWKTIDDETGKPKSLVEISLTEGSLYGTITKLFRGPDEDQNPKCTDCKGEEANKPIIGMQILKSLEQKGSTWSDGTILDPGNGKTYTCKIWLEDDNTLKVRGYLGPFFRTQTWHRVPAAE